MKKVLILALAILLSTVGYAQCPPPSNTIIAATWKSTTHDYYTSVNGTGVSPHRVAPVPYHSTYKILAQTGNSAFTYTWKVEDSGVLSGAVSNCLMGFIPPAPGTPAQSVTTSLGTITWDDAATPVHTFLSIQAGVPASTMKTVTIASNPYSNRNLELFIQPGGMWLFNYNCRPQPYGVYEFNGTDKYILDQLGTTTPLPSNFLEITIPPSGQIYMVDEIEHVVPGMMVIDLQYGLNNVTTWYNYDPATGIPPQAAGTTIRFRAKYFRTGNTNSYKVQIVTPWGTFTGAQIPSGVSQTYVPTPWYTVTAGTTYGDIFLRRTSVIP